MDHLHLRAADVPAELRDQRRFLPWERRGRKKLPLDRHGEPCNPDDPANWQYLSDASQQSYYSGEGPRGIGYALRESGIVVFDFDRCVDQQTGAISPEARRWLDLFGSATELSPSGTGMHLLVAGLLPEGNQKHGWGDLLTRGYVTVTGHPMIRAPIREGGEPLERLRRLSPKAATVTPLPVASPAVVDAVLASTMPNAKFRRLWRGDWSDYATRSEADAAFAMHLARNGGGVSEIVELLRASKLPRDPRRNQRYLKSTAAFVLVTAEVRVSQWSGVTIEPEDRADRLAMARLRSHPVLAHDADLLIRLFQDIEQQWQRGHGEGGYIRVSPQNLAGDFAPRAGCPDPQRLMSRDAARRALTRLSSDGLIDMRKGRGLIQWTEGGRTRSRIGGISLVLAEGSTLPELVDTITARANRHPLPTPCVCIARGRNAETGVAA